MKKGNMSISPFDPVVFCVAMQAFNESLDYTVLYNAFQHAKKYLRMDSTEDEKSNFAKLLLNDYCDVYPIFQQRAVFLNVALFMVHECKCYIPFIEKTPWSGLELAHLIRGIFLYGTSYVEISTKVFYNRTVPSIKNRWERLFNDYFKKFSAANSTASALERNKNFSKDEAEEIANSFDEKLLEKFSSIKLTMTYKIARQLVDREQRVPASQLIDMVFKVCQQHVMLNEQLVAMIRCYNSFTLEINEDTIFEAFLKRKNEETAWLTLEQFLYQKMISPKYVETFLAKHKLKPISGFKINPEEEFYSSINVIDRIDSFTKYKVLRNAATRLINVGVQTESTQEKSKTKSRINLIEESVDHVKGIPYSEEARALYEILYIMKPSVVSVLNECGVAPHPDTVFNWLEKKEKDLIFKVDDESAIPEIIHNITDMHTVNIKGRILANLAGDGLYLADDRNKRVIQYYVIQLQPLNKNIPCVCINITSIGKKSANKQMTSSEIIPKLKRIAKIINNDKSLKFDVIYLSTDADTSTDFVHKDFFNKFIKNIWNKKHGESHDETEISLIEEAMKFDFSEFIPISDFLHIIKTARAHILNHAMRLGSNRTTLNLDRIKEILDIGDALDDVSHWAKMSDVYAIALFQFVSFKKIRDKLGNDEDLFMAPFTFLNEAIRSTSLSKKERLVLIESAFHLFKWNLDMQIQNPSADWKGKYSEKCKGTLLGTEIFLIRCINLCFGLTIALTRDIDIPLDRVGSHVLENYFGFVRLASKNKHTPKMLKTQSLRVMIMTKNLSELGIEYKHKGRENMGGVLPTAEMETNEIFSDIKPIDLVSQLFDGKGTALNETFKKYDTKIKNDPKYPRIYYPDAFSSKQASQRIKQSKNEPGNIIPLNTGQWPFPWKTNKDLPLSQQQLIKKEAEKEMEEKILRRKQIGSILEFTKSSEINEFSSQAASPIVKNISTEAQKRASSGYPSPKRIMFF